jgi:sulfite reductase beta subunit-like hemoprotein
LPALLPMKSPIRVPYAEILRQWSSVHPEFSFLPRKFKIAVTGAERDRAAIQVHDIGLHLKKNDKGEIGFAVYVGGGQGRTPMIAKLIKRLPAGRGSAVLLHRDHARVQSARPP